MKPIGRQVLRFAVVGGTATAIHVGTVVVLVEALGAAVLAANLVGFGLALLASYLGNRNWTFASSVQHLRGGTKFFAAALLGLCLNQSILYLGVRLFGWDYRLALLAAVLVVPPVSFVLQKGWVFGGGRALALGR